MESLGIEGWILQFDNDSNHKIPKQRVIKKLMICLSILQIYHPSKNIWG